jgi:hypothetical protein
VEVRKPPRRLVGVPMPCAARRSSLEHALHRRPPLCDVRRRRRMSVVVDPLFEFAASSSTPRDNSWLDSCTGARDRVRRRGAVVRRRAPPLYAATSAAARARTSPESLDRKLTAQIDPSRGVKPEAYRSTAGSRSSFAKETLGSLVFAAAVHSVQTPLDLGPFPCGLNPSFPGFCTRSPTLVFLHHSPEF